MHAGYFDRLRDGKRGIHRLHTRLLALEADKLVEIEKLLTREQLTQLRKDRQVTPPGTGGAERETNTRKR